MNTPIYEALKAEQDAPKNWIPAKPVENWGRFPVAKPWPSAGTRIIPNPKPEPKWRTFLRCMLWWLP